MSNRYDDAITAIQAQRVDALADRLAPPDGMTKEQFIAHFDTHINQLKLLKNQS